MSPKELSYSVCVNTPYNLYISIYTKPNANKFCSYCIVIKRRAPLDMFHSFFVFDTNTVVSEYWFHLRSEREIVQKFLEVSLFQ